MDRLAYTSLASINERRILREQLTNELANVSTVGFKKSFDNALTAVKAEGDGFDSRIQPFIQQKDTISLAPGTLMATGRNMDVAMNDQAVLGVQGKDGTLAFTRRGDLRINSQGALENGASNVVMGQSGNPITIPAGFEVSINKSGDVYARDPAQPLATPAVLIDKLMLRDASKTRLERREDSLFRPQVEFIQGNGDFTTGPVPATVTPQAVEGSNVNPITAMVKMIDFSRTFESNMRFIKEAKSLDESGASMLKAR
jgi:flagellar basal-body rod protein FlgF